MSSSTLRRLAASALALAVSTALSAAEEPRFRLTAPAAGEPVELAVDYLIREHASLGLRGSELEHRVRDVVPTRHNGMTHVYVQQTVDGIDVAGAITTVNVMRDGVILSVANAFVVDATAKVNRSAPALDAQAAYAIAASYLKVPMAQPPQPMAGRGGASRHQLFPGGQLSRQPVPAELVYVQVDGELRLAWNLTIDRFEDETFWAELRIDAESGQVIDIASYVAHARAPAWAKNRGGPGYSASYRVVPIPFESPQDPGAAFELVTDPHDPQASPRGWHDTRGLSAVGFEFAETRGNNVVARADLLSNNNAGNYRAPATVVDGSLVFDFAFDPELPPTSGQGQPSVGNVPPAVVNLFYWNNLLHDILWQYGFDEPAGNFQVNNYGRGGLGNDAVQADALDGSDRATDPNTNNANFATPGDGTQPRMQMYRWTAPVSGRVLVDSPFEASYPSVTAAFGGSIGAPLQGEYVRVNDGGVLGGIEGCSALQNAAQVAGKIALVRRGTCNFTVKALNAQNAGASAVIIYNNQGGDLVQIPGGTDARVTLPVFAISENNGNALADALLSAAASGTITPPTPVGPDRDSDFDAGIIAHEYGHGLSNRLTGGPSASTCLNNAEQKGEGWSDYVGLMVTLREGACRAPRGIGTYPSFQPVGGPGIRRFPYSTNRAVNPFTFADTNDPAQSQPHGIGSVFATMLWDMTCDLMDEHGFDPDLATGTGGNNIAMQLVVDGMKLQPCSPHFVDARNGILAADVANNAGENRCTLWRAFAGRGLGLSASSGLRTNRSDQVEAFNLPVDCADHVVSLQISGLGTASPAVAQGLLAGGTTRFTLTPAAGETLLSVDGCGGTLVGNVYTTAPATADCTVNVVFSEPNPDIFSNGFEDSSK